MDYRFALRLCVITLAIISFLSSDSLCARTYPNTASSSKRSLLQSESSTDELGTGLLVPGRDELASFAATNFFRYADVVPEEAIDWTDKLKPVPHQGNCGSCWAQAAMGAMEGVTAAFFKPPVPPEYSSEEVLECATFELFPGRLGGCAGGYTGLGLLQAVLVGGIALEEDVPYAAFEKNMTLESTPRTVAMCDALTRYQPIEDVGAVPTRILAMKQAVSRQPVAVTVHSSGGSFPDADYSPEKGEIWRGCSTTNKDLTHAVLLVGYGTNADGEEYWIIRNSWGPNWGHGGNIYLPIAETDDFDGGPCGLQVMNGLIPVVSTEEDPCGTYNPCGAGQCIPDDTSANGYTCDCPANSTLKSFDYSTANSTETIVLTTCALDAMCDWWGPELSCGAENTCNNDLDTEVYSYNCTCSDGYTDTAWAEDGSPACIADTELLEKDCPHGTAPYAVQTFDNCFTVRRWGMGLTRGGNIMMSMGMFEELNPGVNCYNMLVGQQLCAPNEDYEEDEPIEST